MITYDKVFKICKDAYEIVESAENVDGVMEIHCSYIDWSGSKCTEYVILVQHDLITIMFCGDCENVTLKTIEEFSLWVDM